MGNNIPAIILILLILCCLYITVVFISCVYLMLYYLNKAMDVLKRAISVNEKQFRHYHINDVDILESPLVVYWGLDDHNKAKVVLERALPINEEQCSLDHFNCGITSTLLGDAYIDLVVNNNFENLVSLFV